jgi:hypothetical protein
MPDAIQSALFATALSAAETKHYRAGIALTTAAIGQGRSRQPTV